MSIRSFPQGKCFSSSELQACYLGLQSPQSRPPGRNKQIPNNFQMSNILKPEGFIVKATSSTRAFLDAWYAW